MGKHKRKHRDRSSSSSESEGDDKIRHYVKCLRKAYEDKKRKAEHHCSPLIEAAAAISPQHPPPLGFNDDTGQADEFEQPPLDSQLLQLLGRKEEGDDKTTQIHKDLAEIWSSVLKSGLSAERRTQFLQDYRGFLNCPLMEPPKVNKEVQASVSEATLARDARLVGVQTRMCSALSALGGALTLLLDEVPASENKIKIIERMGVAAQLIADVHFEQSQARRLILKSLLNKDLAATLTEVSVDGWLFGEDLSDRIKAAKSLERASGELKFRQVTNQPHTAALNSRGPPRQTKYNVPDRRGGPQRRPYRNNKPRYQHQSQVAKGKAQRSPRRSPSYYRHKRYR